MRASFPQAFGRYQLTERLATGGMAVLYRAQVVGAHGFQKPVVIKTIRPPLSEDPTFVEMFIDEANITAALQHPKIAQVIELGTLDDTLFIAMEYVAGIDARRLMNACSGSDRQLPDYLAVHLAHEMLDALDFAHTATDDSGRPLGILHRDVSPGNLLIAWSGAVKLADFGIARAVQRRQVTRTGALKGKLGYMSPEQVRGEPLDPRSDVFSAGVVLAELLMGRRLFTAPSELGVLMMVRDANIERLLEHGTGIAPELRAILERALGSDPEDRFQSARAFRDALAEHLFSIGQRVGAHDLASFIDHLRRDAALDELGATPPAHADTSAIELSAADVSIVGSDRVELVGRDAFAPLGLTPAARLDFGAALGSDPSRGADARPRPDAARERGTTLAPSADLARVTGSGSPEATGLALDDDRVALDGDSLALDDAGVPIGARFDVRAALAPGAAANDPDAARVAGRQGEASRPRPARATKDDVDAGRAPTQLALSAVIGELGREPTPAPRAMRALADLDVGSLADKPPLRLLWELALRRATGRLVVSISGIEKSIYLRNGAPEFVASNVARERLGEFLLARKVISDGELAMVLATLPTFEYRIGDTLVGLGLLSPIEAYRYLSEQVQDKLVDLCTWRKGDYSWRQGVDMPEWAQTLHLDPYAIIGRGAMAMSDDAAEAWLQRYEDRIPRAEPTPPLPHVDFGLRTKLDPLRARLDGRHPVTTLAHAASTADERRELARLLSLLVATDRASWINPSQRPRPLARGTALP